MLYKLSAMDGTSFRQISGETGREQSHIGTQLKELLAINVSLTGTVSRVQVPNIVYKSMC